MGATSSPPDWTTGLLLALFVLVGALVTVFGLIGGAIPGTAGYARIEAGPKRVEELEETLQKLVNKSTPDHNTIKAVSEAADKLRDDLRTDRQRQFREAAFLYAILGAFFAAMLARDFLQALATGAGWTAYLGAIGLKKDYAARKEMKDKVSEKLETALGDSGPPPGFEDLHREARIARAV